MSIKALIQFIILLLIVTIISTVYFKYFENKNSNFSIIGNYHLGVSVSDCINNAKNLVENKL